MSLVDLRIRDLRAIRESDLTFSFGMNLFTGNNGSGKTSLLEAIHLLAVGRTFLPGRTAGLVRQGQDGLTVFGRVRTPGCAEEQIGVSVSAKGERLCRLTGVEQRSMLAVARLLPVFVLEPNSQLLVAGGPGERRRYMDRGLFHVEHAYQAHWAKYRRAIEQRNQILRRPSRPKEIDAWNREVSEHGIYLDRARRTYIERLSSKLEQVNKELQFTSTPVLTYKRGWPEQEELLAALERNLDHDRRYGATSSGPHRADLVITLGDQEARGQSSRGQIKRLVALLVLAQIRHLLDSKPQPVAFLYDDFASELDADSQRKVFESIKSSGIQTFANSLNVDSIKDMLSPQDRLFHVEHGVFSQVV